MKKSRLVIGLEPSLTLLILWIAKPHKKTYKLRAVYNIPDDIDLRIPDKVNTSSRPPKGYVTLYLECFKLGVRQPL